MRLRTTALPDLLGDGEADARRRLVATVQHFEQKKPPAALFTTPDGQKLARACEAAGSCVPAVRR